MTGMEQDGLMMFDSITSVCQDPDCPENLNQNYCYDEGHGCCDDQNCLTPFEDDYIE